MSQLDREGHRPDLVGSSPHHEACGVGFVATLTKQRSHDLVDHGLVVLERLAHRGATGADPDTGDGSGLLLQLPFEFLRAVARDVPLPATDTFGVGVVFTRDDERCDEAVRRVVVEACDEEAVRLLGWREVPVDPSAIGALARSEQPRIRQFFVDVIGLDRSSLERRLYVLRRVIEAKCAAIGYRRDAAHVASLSSRTLVYKGMLTATQLRAFYPDLADPRMTTALAMVHARFSTNVLPRWDLAQPLRMIAHNGEINTLRGNANWMRARESKLRSAVFGHDLEKLRPVLDEEGSDSSQFDNALELLVMAGRPIEHAMLMMIPEAQHDGMDAELRAFYEFHHALLEPWDGPAAITFTDGSLVGASLDRNGLRPARFAVTWDGIVVLASEAGALPLDEARIAHKGRLVPGSLLLVDTEQGRLVDDASVKRRLATAHPYRAWIEAEAARLDAVRPEPATSRLGRRAAARARRRFGWTEEDLTEVLLPMAAGGAEPVGSMGNDTAPAVLRGQPGLFFDYFKQCFAQVTNPPIDPIRESRVMSLEASLGAGGNLLSQGPAQAHRVLLEHPVLDDDAMATLRALGPRRFPVATVSATFDPGGGHGALERALDALCAVATAAVDEGATILVVSDRDADETRAPIPSLLAASAVHHHLVERRSRTSVGMVVETGEAREVAHLAALVAFGAEAVNPYLALASVDELARRDLLGATPAAVARAAYVAALCGGLRKTIARMGISTLESYCGAGAFEALGVDASVVERYFPGTPSRIGGVRLDEIAADAVTRHVAALDEVTAPPAGEYAWRVGGRRHLWEPDAITLLQHAVQADDADRFSVFVELADRQTADGGALRGELELRPRGAPVPLDEVEPVASVLSRFSTGGMSLGALSPEAHETLAIAMNRLGGRSNSGEGGEDAARGVPDANGDFRRSAIRQVASARFGVTAAYLVDADVLQIKIAQGAKPGEGGQLPGGKVDATIARLRHATPGVTLISPPPHHDVYSIEDLAQLIFDLRAVNPTALVSVKLAAEVGVGTVAAGVAKAGADHVVVSGYEGGTGAAPLTAIKHVGVPWELGIAEAHQVLVANGLRRWVRLETDGTLRTGRDVIVAAALGADQFAFGTAPLVALGCVMMRVCHRNTCPVGIATQDERLRARFRGRPEHVMRYLTFVAQDVRRHLASLGLRSVAEAVGATELLEPRAARNRAAALDLRGLLAKPVPANDVLAAAASRPRPRAQRGRLDERLRRDVGAALAAGETCVRMEASVTPDDRALGAGLAGDITRRHGAAGLPDSTVVLELTGSAGQSLGAWLPPGVTLRLSGESNDYVAKGLCGGRVVVAPLRTATFPAHRNVLVGNACLYGATSGECFLRGLAGERFAVRNSGADTVVEGVGDHGCEYMTGGRVVVLGRTGWNFAAGMSGGVAYLLDVDGDASTRVNPELVELGVLDDEDLDDVRAMLERHVRWTESPHAEQALSAIERGTAPLLRVLPREFAAARRSALRAVAAVG